MQRGKLRRISRRSLIGSGAAAAVIAAGSLSVWTEPRRGGLLRVAVPASQRAMPDGGIYGRVPTPGFVFECLAEIGPDGQLRGELATEWAPRGDASAWVVSLREDAVFHDGRPFTADDAVASLRRHLRSEVLEEVEGVRKLGSHQFQVTLASPDPGFPFVMSDPALVMLPAEGTGEALRDGVGTGIYRLRQRHETSVRLDRVTDHRKDGSAGWFDAVELLTIEKPADRMAALQAGRADAAAEVDPCDPIASALRRQRRIVSLRSNRRLEIRAAGRNARALAEALKAGLDRAGLLHDVLGGEGRIGADHPLSLGRPPEQDPERARDVLRRARVDRATLTLGPGIAGFPGLDRLIRTLRRFGEESGLAFAAGGPTSDLILALAPAQPTEDLALRRFVRMGVEEPARVLVRLAEARRMSNTVSRQEIQAEIAQVLAKEALTVVPVFAYPQFAHSVRLTHLGHIGALDALDSARIAKRWFYGSFG